MLFDTLCCRIINIVSRFLYRGYVKTDKIWRAKKDWAELVVSVVLRCFQGSNRKSSLLPICILLLEITVKRISFSTTCSGFDWIDRIVLSVSACQP